MTFRPLFLALLTAAAAVPARAQEPRNVVTGASSAYQLRPGDVLDIRVWGNDDFSGRFQVDENWQIQYPVVGEIDVRSLTVAQVRERLREGLSQIFQRPFITVTPLFRMAVLGHVQNPGLYTVDPTLSILDVVALAGGPDGEGNINKIRLLRTGEQSELSFEREALRGRTLGEIGVRSGDEIVVPRRWFTRNDLVLVIGIAQVALSIAIFISVN